MDEVKKRTENNGTWKEWDVDLKAKNLGIEQGLKEYMTWQQGRGGVIDIITTAYSGNFRRYKKNDTIPEGLKIGDPVVDSKGMTQRDRIIANLSDDMKDNAKNLSDKDLALIWVGLSKDKWATKKREFEDPVQRKDFYSPDIQESVMDLNEDIFK